MNPGQDARAGTGAGAAPAVLDINNIEVVYNKAVQVLRGLSLSVPAGSIVALLGSNGAGKSTTLKAVSGLLDLEDGALVRGQIVFGGGDTAGVKPQNLVRSGLAHVMEGRRVFEDLTVEENLVAATYALTGRPGARVDFDLVYGYFPRLYERRRGLAGYLSGGEQQMLAVARILRTGAKLLLLDEISEGLAPVIVQALARMIVMLREKGYTVVMVEQNFRFAAPLADRFYVMEHGRIALEFGAAELEARMPVLNQLLGV